MIPALITFSIALVGLIGLIGYRMWQIKNNRVLVGEQTGEKGFYLNEREIEARVSLFMKHMSRVFVLYALKISIKASFFVRKKINAIVKKAQTLAERHQKEITAHEESAGAKFLKAIAEYKTKIENLRKKDKTFDEM